MQIQICNSFFLIFCNSTFKNMEIPKEMYKKICFCLFRKYLQYWSHYLHIVVRVLVAVDRGQRWTH